MTVLDAVTPVTATCWVRLDHDATASVAVAVACLACLALAVVCAASALDCAAAMPACTALFATALELVALSAASTVGVPLRSLYLPVLATVATLDSLLSYTSTVSVVSPLVTETWFM